MPRRLWCAFRQLAVTTASPTTSSILTSGSPLVRKQEQTALPPCSLFHHLLLLAQFSLHCDTDGPFQMRVTRAARSSMSRSATRSASRVTAPSSLHELSYRGTLSTRTFPCWGSVLACIRRFATHQMLLPSARLLCQQRALLRALGLLLPRQRGHCSGSHAA